MGFIVGDVQLSRGDVPDEETGIQKIVPLTPQLAAGFAGNLGTGVDLLGDLASFCESTPTSNPDAPAIEVVEQWSASGRPARIFTQCGRRHARLLVVYGWLGGVINTESPPAEQGRFYGVKVAMLQPPGFAVQPRDEVCSIGIGGRSYSDVESTIRGAADQLMFWSFERSMAGTARTLLAHLLTDGMAEAAVQDPTVSRRLEGALIHRGGMEFFSNEVLLDDPTPRYITRTRRELEQRGIIAAEAAA